MRDRIRHGLDGLEPEDAVLVAAHDAAAIRAITLRILHVVVAGRVGLPDIDLAVGNRTALSVLERADDEERLALGIMRHGRAGGHLLGLVGVEGAQDGAVGRAGRFGMIDRVDQERQTEHVGEQDELLSHVAADLADLGQEQQAGHPFFGAETGLARKVVQVSDEPLEDVFHALVLAERVDEDDILGDVVDGEVLEGRDLDLGGVHGV